MKFSSHLLAQMPPQRNVYLSWVMLLVLLVALLSVSFVAFFLYTQNTVEAVEQAVLEGMRFSVGEMRRTLDDRFAQTADSVRILLGTVYPALNEHSTLDTQLAEYSENTRLLNEYVGKYMIGKARLYVPAEKIYSRQHETFFPVDELAGDETFRALRAKQSSGVFWQETHTLDLGLNGEMRVVSCGGAVVGRADYNELVGVLFFDIPVTRLVALLDGGANGLKLFLVNEAGRILADPDLSRIGAQGVDPALLSGDAAQTPGDSLFVCAKLNTCGWYLVGEKSRGVLYNPDSQTMNLLRGLWFTVVLIVIGIAMMIAYNFLLSRTIRTIQNAILRLENGGEADETPSARLDALSRLGVSAQKMADTAERVVAERYQNRLAIAEYQMQSLQAQIKPHFLYNTLDVIKWMMLDGDQAGSVFVINALSKYLRLSINKGPGVVTLEEELALTRSYLDIMQRRFVHVFTVRFEVEPEALACRMPKLSLQPITENALLHGLLYCKKEDKALVVRACVEERDVVIEVEDNGNGMSPETLARLSGAGKGAGYGVANVRERLRLFGGDRCRLEIHSKEGAGTCVVMRVPMTSD